MYIYTHYLTFNVPWNGDKKFVTKSYKLLRLLQYIKICSLGERSGDIVLNNNFFGVDVRNDKICYKILCL